MKHILLHQQHGRRIVARKFDARWQDYLCFELIACTGTTLTHCEAANPETRNDHGGEAHGFIANICTGIVFDHCISRWKRKPGTKPEELEGQEDHFNAYNSSVDFICCRAEGDVRTTGTSFCIDRGSTSCKILDCTATGRNAGITIADGCGHVVRRWRHRVRVSGEWYGGRVEATLVDCTGPIYVGPGATVYIMGRHGRIENGGGEVRIEGGTR